MAEAFKRITEEKRDRRARLQKASDKFKEEIQKCIDEEFNHQNIKYEFIPTSRFNSYKRVRGSIGFTHY